MVTAADHHSRPLSVSPCSQLSNSNIFRSVYALVTSFGSSSLTLTKSYVAKRRAICSNVSVVSNCKSVSSSICNCIDNVLLPLYTNDFCVASRYALCFKGSLYYI
eukprot:677908_1